MCACMKVLVKKYLLIVYNILLDGQDTFDCQEMHQNPLSRTLPSKDEGRRVYFSLHLQVMINHEVLPPQ